MCRYCLVMWVNSRKKFDTCHYLISDHRLSLIMTRICCTLFFWTIKERKEIVCDILIHVYGPWHGDAILDHHLWLQSMVRTSLISDRYLYLSIYLSILNHLSIYLSSYYRIYNISSLTQFPFWSLTLSKFYKGDTLYYQTRRIWQYISPLYIFRRSRIVRILKSFDFDMILFIILNCHN